MKGVGLEIRNRGGHHVVQTLTFRYLGDSKKKNLESVISEVG